MVVTSVRSTPASPPVVDLSSTTSASSTSTPVEPLNHRRFSYFAPPYFHPHPFLFTMYSPPGFNPYSSGPSGHSGIAGPPPYPVFPAAASDMSHGSYSYGGYSSKYGPPSGGGSGYGGSSYGPSSSGGYDYHPAPPPQQHHHHHPVPIHISSSPKSGKKGKGAALSALTLLAFLYFLNLLQSCLKEHMDTMNPTVMVMTAGATRRKDMGDVLLTAKDGDYGGDVTAEGFVDQTNDDNDDNENRFHLLTSSISSSSSSKGNRTRGGPSFFGGTEHDGDNYRKQQNYRIRMKNYNRGQHQRVREVDGEMIYYDYY